MFAAVVISLIICGLLTCLWLREGQYWIVTLTLLALLMTCAGLMEYDPEGKLFGTEIGSLGACFMASFLVIFRKRIPVLLAWTTAAGLIIASLYATSYSCVLAGTIYTHLTDHLDMLFAALVGTMIAIFLQDIRR